MGKIVYVELLDKRGSVRQRHRLDALPATIGRAYSNSVIIDDKHVCPEHLRVSLDEEGAIVIEDLKSVNGICLSTSTARVPGHSIPPGKDAEIVIGETRLRFRGEDYSVGPAEARNATQGVMQRVFERKGTALLVFLLSFGLYTIRFYLESHDGTMGKDLVAGSLVFLIILLLWAGFWSVLNRVTSHAFNFISHLALVGAAAAGMLVFSSINEYYEFFFTADRSSSIIGLLLFTAIFSWLFYGHRSMMHASSMRKRVISSAIAGCCIVGIVGLFAYINETEYTNKLRYSAELKPFGHQLVRTETPEQFLGGLESLRKDVDAMVEKEKPKHKKKQ